LRFVIPILLIPQHDVIQRNADQIRMAAPNVVPENCRRTIVEPRQNFRAEPRLCSHLSR
jgi:hypothetical protein